MKNKRRLAIFLATILASTAAFSACNNSDDSYYYFKEEPITDIYATFADGSGRFASSQDSFDTDVIAIDFPYYYPENSQTPIDISRMKVFITCAKGFTVLTPLPEIVDLTKKNTLSLRNPDGKRLDIAVTGAIQKNSAAKILHFALPQAGIVGVISEAEKRIGLDMQGKDLSGLIPEIRISGGATISPAPTQAQDFNNPVEYTVTAQDGTVAKYVTTDIRRLDGFEIHRGVNIASWLSTPKFSGEERVAFFTEADVKFLAQTGFDHIRLCVDETALWDDGGAKIRKYGFDLLHDAIGWCMKYNIRVLVDMHITRNHRFTNSENPLFTDPAEPEKFVKIWKDLSDELKEYPNSLVAYELLNEPCSNDPANWNRVADLAISAIRAKEPDRTIVVGVCSTKGSAKYNALTLSRTHRILMTFHFYSPYIFTAYGMQDTTNGIGIPMYYPGQLVPDAHIGDLPEKWQYMGAKTYTKEVLRDGLMAGIKRAKALDVPVFVGEFGTMKWTPEPSRANWYRDIVDILNENGVAYTSFDYKGAAYSIVGDGQQILYPEIVDILTR